MTYLQVTQFETMAMRAWSQPNIDDWAEVLADFPLFAGVSKRNLRKLVRSASFAEFAPGDTVVSSGSVANSLYVILGGTAKARAKPAARTLRVGDYFGELGIIDEAPRSATIVATDELHVMRMPSRSFLRVAQRSPEVMRTMLTNLSARLRSLEAAPAA
jgi:CRP/FNR family transcriptional regulator, cyclic AMP receptor protein